MANPPNPAVTVPVDERFVRMLTRPPTPQDDKYSRGVLGVLTGSERYPGAAVLGVEAAARTGIGMVRYLGPERPTALVLARRPEVVPSPGRVQAWLLGSGTDPADRDDTLRSAQTEALASAVPVVLDAGALDLALRRDADTVITPHSGELAALLLSRGHHVSRDDIVADPQGWAIRAAEETGCTVLLKGHTTHICSADAEERYAVTSPTTRLATAGSGDVLAGITGALLALNEPAIREGRCTPAQIAAAAVWIHGHAGAAASAGGPLVALDITAAIPAVIARISALSRVQS